VAFHARLEDVMPRDHRLHPQPSNAQRAVPLEANDVDAAIAASLHAAENEGWPPIRAVNAAPERLADPNTTVASRTH
jgi:hypothetical protein